MRGNPDYIIDWKELIHWKKHIHVCRGNGKISYQTDENIGNERVKINIGIYLKNHSEGYRGMKFLDEQKKVIKKVLGNLGL